MNKDNNMNILVLGSSGAGKSTLIGAVSGAKVQTGVGEGNTDRIDVYESDTWPMRFIDTKGFEYSLIAQHKTIKQIKKYTNEQLDDDKEEDQLGIDAVWYCVEGTARRTFSHNIELMNKAIKGWKNVPIFAVITKSYSEIDIPENIQAVSQAFAKSKNVNLQKIVPVVAQEYKINEDVSVPPTGIDTLCSATLDCADTAKSINKENRYRMILEQKRFTANAVVGTATASASVIGAIPLNFADSLILVPLETALTKAILKVYSVKLPGDVISAIVGSAAITNVAKAAITPLKALPIAGSVINGVVAGAIVLTLGEAEIATAEAIYTEKIDPKQVEKIIEEIEKKFKESKILGEVIKYLEENAPRLEKKNAKEIFDAIQDILKTNLTK